MFFPRFNYNSNPQKRLYDDVLKLYKKGDSLEQIAEKLQLPLETITEIYHHLKNLKKIQPPKE